MPAGSPDGGQWTDVGGSYVRVADNDSGPGGIATDAATKIAVGYKIDHRTPGDAVTLFAPDGSKFLAPPAADFQSVYDYGKTLRGKTLSDLKKGIGEAVGQGGRFDFQRNGNIFLPAYTDASNYAVGVLMNGAGLSWIDTVVIGGGYATLNSSTGLTKEMLRWWGYGYGAAQRGELPVRKIALPPRIDRG